MKNKIIVSPEEIKSMVLKGGRMVFKKEAENELLKLLSLKDKIDQAISEVKENILKAGHSITPDFVGVIGKKVRCVVRKYGDKYKIQGETSPRFIKETIIKRANSDEIELEIEKTGKLPEGIKENEREEKLTIIVPNELHQTIKQLK